MNDTDEMLTLDTNGHYDCSVYKRFMYCMIQTMQYQDVRLTEDEKRLLLHAFSRVPAKDCADFIRDNLHYLVTKWLLIRRVTGNARWPRV